MSLLKKFQKNKWEKLAKSDASYYVFSDKIISNDEEKYRASGASDLKKFVLDDEQLSGYLTNKSAKTCLEFGCGNGRMSEFLAANFKYVYAVDISARMITVAKKRLARLPNIGYIISDGEKIDLPEKSVDFVFSYAVLQHFPSKSMVKNTLREFYRVMNNGAVAKIQFRGRPAYGGFLRYIRWYYGVCFSENEIKNILSGLGFEIISSEGGKTKLLWLIIKKV